MIDENIQIIYKKPCEGPSDNYNYYNNIILNGYRSIEWEWIKYLTTGVSAKVLYTKKNILTSPTLGYTHIRENDYDLHHSYHKKHEHKNGNWKENQKNSCQNQTRTGKPTYIKRRRCLIGGWRPRETTTKVGRPDKH